MNPVKNNRTMKCMILCVVLLTGISGALGDLICFSAKYPQCSLESALGAKDLCDVMPKAQHCVSDVATSCGVSEVKEVKDVEEVFNNVCKNGTDLNKEYQMHKSCVVDLYGEFLFKCSKDLLKELVALTPEKFPAEIRRLILHATNLSPENSDKVKRYLFKNVMCRYRASIDKCMHSIVIERCGNHTIHFYYTMFGPGEQLSKKSMLYQY